MYLLEFYANIAIKYYISKFLKVILYFLLYLLVFVQ